MNPRVLVPLLVLVLGAALAGYWLASQGQRPPPASSAVVSAPDAKPPPAQPPPSPEPAAMAARPAEPAEPQMVLPAPKPAGEPASARALRLNPSPPDPLADDPARQEAEAIALNIRQYMLRFGGNPVGTNAEIVAELNGGNPKNARYLPSELMRLNDQGELIDRWGTPYFFHQEASDKMEVRSAGPDKKLFTSDDLVSY